MNIRKQRLKYLFFDYTAALLAWLGFYTFRRMFIDHASEKQVQIFLTGELRFWIPLIFLPLIWIAFYRLLGHYQNVWMRSRLNEMWHTFLASLIGSYAVFFFLILDDVVSSYRDYYLSFVALFGLHFVLTWIFRISITTRTKNKINQGKIGFRTLVIGSAADYARIADKITKSKSGHKILGRITLNEASEKNSADDIPVIGLPDDLSDITEKYKIEEVIFANENMDVKTTNKILYHLRSKDVLVKAVPALSNVLAGKVRMSFFIGAPLAVVNVELMKLWQKSVKRIFDIVFSSTALLLFTPLFPFIAAGIKLSSRGPVFYFQERIGKYGKIFRIYKFRSMYTDAEKNGPQLSSGTDPRITSFGRFMRRYRIDEIPQFFNVLKGDMSVVGPRPERRYYARKIMEKAPEYSVLWAVRPGITSWGAVMYGYTETLDQMLEQLEFDLYYVKNMSLFLDFKILIKTVFVVLNRSGK